LPAKLSTTINKIKLFSNQDNAELIFKFYEFMKYNGISERHQNNNLKAIISYSNYLSNKSFKDVYKKEDILSYLHTKIKNKEKDPKQKWITTYNDYLHRIKHFYNYF
jgi:hypothetical protein